MTLRFHAFLASIVIALAAPTAPAAPESSEDDAPPPSATFLIDIEEKIQGEPSEENRVTYWVRTMLRQAGMAGYAHRPTIWDDDEDEAARLDEPRLDDADFILRGTAETELLDKSIFYGKVVANSMRSHVEVELIDPSRPEDERLLHRWTLDEDWGDGGLEEGDVARKALDRMGYRVAGLAIRQADVHALVAEDLLEGVDGLVEQIRDELGFLQGDEDADPPGGDENTAGDGAGDDAGAPERDD